jgi:hypothetical protein
MIEEPFPPVSSRSDDIRLLVEVLSSALAQRSTWYLSTPITTGARFSEWQETQDLKPTDREYAASFAKHVVEPNIEAAKEVVERLRGDSRIVIDPTSVGAIEGWSQADYHVFWGEVIETFSHSVVFMNGWHESNGCVYEFVVAQRAGCSTYGQDLSPIDVTVAIRLIEGVIEGARQSGESRRFLEGAVRQLRSTSMTGATT